MEIRDQLIAKFARANRRGPGPPTWPKNPRQDSYGNPTTKKPGDVGTAIRAGKHPKWRDLYGARRPHGSKE